MSAAVELIDDHVRRRIRTELDASLCVEAGAGTGKTTVLVDRVVALLVSGRAGVDELAVITFTEKAAGELSARLRFALEEARDDPRLLPAERDRVHQALGELYRARVQTIHAFASDLLRERPVEAELDPQFETMDDVSAEVHLEDAYRRWLDGRLAQSSPEVEWALRRGFDLGLLRQLVDAVHRHREVLPLAPMAWSPPDIGSFRTRAADWAARLGTLEACCRRPEDDQAYAHLLEVRDFCEEMGRTSDDAEAERLVLFEAPWPKFNVGRQGDWDKGACDDVRAVFREYRPEVEALAPALRSDALVRLLPLAEDFAGGYAARRRRDGLADFDDLLIWARDLLRDDLGVRRHFHTRTTHVLVDEFQDTDPVQAELITWLCAPPGAAGDWRSVTPVPGSLFVVGDPKQSIYRFRGADIAVYDAVKGGPLGGEVALLAQNFRGSRELLDWLNHVFDRVLEEAEGVQPGNAALVGRVSMASSLGRPPVVIVRSEEPAADAGALRDVEAGLLARTISRAVRDEAWPVRDRRAGERVRPARWADVAILVPSRTGIERLEATLQRYGVPYRFEGGRGFFSRQEVRDLVSLLHAVDDPTDAISLVAALRSLAFGCSDEDLLLWQLDFGRFDYRMVRASSYADAPDGPAGPAAVREAMLILSELNRATRGLSLAELVREAVTRTGLVEAALSLPSGRQSAANVMKLLDHAREFSAAGNGALRAFTGWLARMRDREVDETDAPVAEERDDTVRVMTIHAAKGLEFPIVCLGNLSATGSNQMPPVPDAAGHAIELTLGNKQDKRDFRTPGWDDVKARERLALAAERDRLLYVACTRARDHLVVPACEDVRGARGFMERLKPSVTDEDSGWVYDVQLLESVAAVAAPVEARAGAEAVAEAVTARSEWVAERDALVAHAATGVELVTASGVKVDPRPLAAASPARADDGDEGPTIDVDSTPPLELGDAFHRVMEQVSLPDGEDLEALAEAVCAEAGLGHEVSNVVEMARRCLAAPVVRRALASGTAEREVPFVLDEGDGRVLVGRMDLLFRDDDGGGDGAVVVDYKTDAVVPGEEAAAAERWHRGQAEVYRRAGEAALGVAVEVVLVFARTGGGGGGGLTDQVPSAKPRPIDHA